jgi:hypothetical protein
MQSVSCSVCGEGGHLPSRCPELYEPLRPGFSGAGGGGGGGGGDEDEDERGYAYASNTEQESTKSIHDTENVVVDRVNTCRGRSTHRGDRVIHQNL